MAKKAKALGSSFVKHAIDGRCTQLERWRESVDSFAEAARMFTHQEWGPSTHVTILPCPPFVLYHYTLTDPAQFAQGLIQSRGRKAHSFWCSIKTSDRNCIHVATGIGIYVDKPMWRIELELAEVEDATALGVMVGHARWPTDSLYPPANEYEIRQTVPLAGCKVVPI